MQMIFNALSGSSSQVPVTPVGGNKLYCALWEQHALWILKELNAVECEGLARETKRFKVATEKWHQLQHSRVPHIMQLGRFFERRTIHLASVINSHYSHRVQYILFPPTGVTGTGPELPKRALNVYYRKSGNFRVIKLS